MDITVLALDNCLTSSISGPCDLFKIASLEQQQQSPDTTETLFSTSVITYDGQPAKPFSGPAVQPDYSCSNCPDPDIIFIPVIYGDPSHVLSQSGLSKWLIGQHERGCIICGVCAGVFVIARTGLLNGRQATTHWFLADDFKARFPLVRLNKKKMIVDEGDIITAGGVTAYMDLSLYLAARFGSKALSLNLSRMLLIDPVRHSQSPYTAFDFNTTHNDEPVLKAQIWMKENIKNRISVSGLSEVSGLGERTFARRFKKATGDTPLRYLQGLRIAKAKSLLERTGKTIDEIVYETGYEDTSSFRRLFIKSTGLTPGAYKKRFHLP